MVTNDAGCTREFKSWIAVAKEDFSRANWIKSEDETSKTLHL